MSMRSWAYPRRAFLWPLLGFGLILGIILASSLLAYAIRGPGTGFVFFPFWGFGWVFFLLFFLFFWSFRWWGWIWGRWGWYGRPYGWGGYEGDAREIVRSRYARGEITKDQFDQMMRDLEQHP